MPESFFFNVKIKNLFSKFKYYKKNNIKCQNLYHIPCQPWTNISPLADIRVSVMWDVIQILPCIIPYGYNIRDEISK